MGKYLKHNYLAAPIWQKKHSYFKNIAPKILQEWLMGRESLTYALTCTCPGNFSVKVLHEGWQKPHLSESIALGLKTNSLAFVRQVHLFCDNQAWVHARTVIPQKTLHGELQKLTQLGSRPLGAVLFANKHIQRGSIEVARISHKHQLHQTALIYSPKTSEQIWGRRSLFHIANRPLMVSEIFLPGIHNKKRRPPCKQT